MPSSLPGDIGVTIWRKAGPWLEPGRLSWSVSLVSKTEAFLQSCCLRPIQSRNTHIWKAPRMKILARVLGVSSISSDSPTLP